MSNKQVIHTDKAPQPLGPYTQAIKAGNTVYLAGQIPFVPETGMLIEGDIAAQIQQTFENLAAVAKAAGGDFSHIVRVAVYLLDLSYVPLVNAYMEAHFPKPFPVRTTIGVAGLPKGSQVEVDAVMVL